MLLAAGRGERMRPLTERIPKPLLEVGGKPLIGWHLERLAAAGFRDVVINHAHLGSMIEEALGDGSGHGLRIRYSREPEPLETAGGIARALPLLGDSAFLVVNADIYCEFDFRALEPCLERLGGTGAGDLAHLVLVPNPPQHPGGDFALTSGRADTKGAPRLTFSGIGAYRRELFSPIRAGNKAKLAPLLREAMARERVSGEVFRGRWIDVGTPQRLAALDQMLHRDSGEGLRTRVAE